MPELLRDPLERALASAVAAMSLSRGMFFAVSTLYFTRGVGLSAAVVGIGLTVSGGVGFLASYAGGPIRQAFLNGMIPSEQRATILSFDSLLYNAGGMVAQPALGKSADVWGYQVSYLLSAAMSALALPFIARARRLNTPADRETAPPPQTEASSAEQIDT